MVKKEDKIGGSQYNSLREFWLDPIRNRRMLAGGRRQADSAVCMFHDMINEDTSKQREHICNKISSLKEDVEKKIEDIKSNHIKDDEFINKRVARLSDKMIGKWPFGIIVIVFMLAVGLINLNNSFILDKMNSDIEKLKEITYTIKKNTTNGGSGD